MKTESTRRWLALGALAVAMLTIGLDMTVLTVALPTLAVDLNADNGALQWFSTAYTLALAAAMLPAGAIGDRFGRKKILLGALILFGAASLACAFAATSGQLVAARVVLGVAAAAMMPLSMAVLPVLFGDPAERARAMSIWVTSTALGLPLGPILGGWLIDNFWWGSVFLINVPMVIIGALAVAALVPESRNPERRPLDLLGAALSMIGMLGLTYGFIRLGTEGWGDGPAWAVLGAGVAALAVFLLRQRGIEYPLIDLSLFRARGFRWGTILTVLITFGMFGLFFTVPQYYQAVLGVDALGSGLRLLPLIAGLLVGARLCDRLLPRVGAGPVVTAGMATLAVGLGLGALTSVDTPYWYGACWIALTGAGMGVAMPVGMSVAIDDLDVARAGMGSALIQALRQAAGTIAVALLGTVLATVYRSELGDRDVDPIRDGVNSGVAVAKATGDQDLLVHVQTAFVSGMDAMLLVCAAICAVAAPLAMWVLPRGRKSVPESRTAADATESTHVG
ncbi:DHA2 family efflux MFS transporter permease subunit [Nocardia bovistercoris]|uniref:DHA2 family efflux MFS transporter permease subunit n=1 Tax=Nocardia bovistercoris TaxID=2785916 RepID=A0A931N4C3_9NOCA|nr:DHA2 family efflux MFS transporter permease subunit [Nocardia bovistercoris]MBH0777473.1 DHA2 family efflux MFS transporter permease subunit [Nocardia bovistercoris]